MNDLLPDSYPTLLREIKTRIRKVQGLWSVLGRKNMRSEKKLPAGIQYAGLSGVSPACQDGVVRFFQFGARISLARILTHQGYHCLLLTVNDHDTVAIKSGFKSGYGGQGPRTFSFVLELLHFYGVELLEYDVSAELLERLDLSALTVGDIENIENAKPVRPSRWPDYVFEEDWAKGRSGALWQNFPAVIPLAIIDTRITDLAMNFFERPDENLLIPSCITISNIVACP